MVISVTSDMFGASRLNSREPEKSKFAGRAICISIATGGSDTADRWTVPEELSWSGSPLGGGLLQHGASGPIGTGSPIASLVSPPAEGVTNISRTWNMFGPYGVPL